MPKKTFALLAVFSLFLLPVPGLAAGVSPWTEAETYQEKALRKLDFGLKNLFFGWTELVEEPLTAYRNKEDHRMICRAKWRGLGHALADTAGGALHTATFFIPQIDIPLPENGVEY